MGPETGAQGVENAVASGGAFLPRPAFTIASAMDTVPEPLNVDALAQRRHGTHPIARTNA
jgi:hypothetical protein